MKPNAIVAIVALTSFASSAVSAELKPGSAADLKAVATAWDIGNKDWSKKCRIDLKTAKAKHGLVIEVAENCARDFPIMTKVKFWRAMQGETIDLINASGGRVLRFVLHPGDGMYTPEPKVDGIYSIGLAM